MKGETLFGPPGRARRLAIAALVGGVLLAGCGGASPRPPATGAGRASASASAADTGGGAAHSTTTAPAGGAPNALAFSRCMRANGVPDFPDPSPGGGFQFSTSGVTSAPAFQAARVKCRRFAPAPPGASGGSGFSAQTRAHALAQLRGVAQCMRKHGVSDFPDPQPNRPANLGLGKYSEITDYEGVFLLFPATVNMQAPAWVQAASACGSLAESFNHPHH